MAYFSQMALSLSLIIVLLILLPSSSSSTTLLVSQTCKKVLKVEKGMYTKCVSLFGSDGRSKSATTVEELGVIAFDLLRKKSMSVQRQMEALSRSSKFDAGVKRGLKDCAEIYSDAVDNAEEALEAYKIKDYDTANIRISAAMNSPTDCEDGFSESSKASPVTKVNNDMFEWCRIPLAFTTFTPKFV